MNVKVVVIVVFVAVLVLLGAPLILGVASGNLGQPGAKGQADAEWTDTKLAGTQWGATLSQALPEIPGLGGGAGTVTADVALSFSSGGTFTLAPSVTFSEDTPAMIKNMAQKMMADVPQGKWSLDYPKLTLTMTDPKDGKSESIVTTINGNTISGLNLPIPGAEPLVLTRRY